METRENEVHKSSSMFDGNDIVLAVKIVDNISSTLEIMYYLMEHEEGQSFVIMLISAQNIDLQTLLEEERRDTDILFEIDKENSVYAIICQDTKIDGGYHFAERVVGNIIVNKGEDVYCAEQEVRATHHNIKYVVLKLTEAFIKAKQDKKHGEIVFRTLH